MRIDNWEYSREDTGSKDRGHVRVVRSVHRSVEGPDYSDSPDNSGVSVHASSVHGVGGAEEEFVVLGENADKEQEEDEQELHLISIIEGGIHPHL